MSGVAFGLYTEHASFGLDDPLRWVPDLAVGMVFLVSGCFVVDHARSAGLLMAATGVTWWLGNLVPDALYLHRGLVLHTIAAYPGWKRESRWATASVFVLDALVVIPAIGRTHAGTTLFGVAVIAVAVWRYRGTTGRARRLGLASLRAAIALLIGTAGATVLRVVMSATPAAAAEPTLLVYESTLMLAGFFLWTGLREPSAATLADLVVELDESSSGTLRDSLRRLLGDPLLEVGFRTEDGSYVSSSGAPIDVSEREDDRVVTPVSHEDSPETVIVHHGSVLDDGAFLEAIRSATRLSQLNASLNAEMRARLESLIDSRRRIITAESEERRRLAARLRQGPEAKLIDVEDSLNDVVHLAEDESSRVAAQRALDQLRLTRQDLASVVAGLQPRELEGTLRDALANLLGSMEIPSQLEVVDVALPAATKAALYYICAEALSNVIKHASANHVSISVRGHRDGVQLTFSDDGIGGADMRRGTGLQGLADRVGALGGTFELESEPGKGTSLVVELQLDDQTQSMGRRFS